MEAPNLNSKLMQEEIFGPILPLQSYSDLKALVENMRVKPKPLVVYFFSSDSKAVDYVQQNTYSGAFVVNDAVVQMLNCHLPFGGVGESGYGRYHG